MITYRKASFRGVEFETTDRGWSSGRRNQIHEYPDKNIPYTEDLGKKAETYQITAYVIGENFQEQRDALIRACTQKGYGTLIHPDYGSVSVLCDSINVKETHSSQRMAVIELMFVESGEQAIPETTIDYAGQVSAAASELTDAAKESFSLAFIVSDGIEGLTSLVGGIADLCTSGLETIGTGIGYAEGLVDDVKSATNKVVAAASYALALKTQVKVLLNTPSALAAQLDFVYSAIVSLGGKSTNSFKEVRNLASKSNASENASTSNDDAIAEKKCMQQIEQLTKQIIVAKEAEVITAIEFTNAEDAEAVLDEFLEDVENIELFEDIEPSSEIMQNLRGLRDVVIEYVQDIVLALPRTKTIQLPEQTPSLALSYDLYEDISRADEIVQKNKIQFPGFIPAGKDLKVLNE